MTAPHAYDLRIEQRREPLGLDATRPRASWRLRGAAVEAPMLRVTCTAADGSDWRSPWATERPADGIAIDAPLSPRTRYTVRLEQEDGAAGTRTLAETSFETGYLGTPLPGAWIGRDRRFDRPDRSFDPPVDDGIPVSARRIPPALNLRRAFRTDAPVRTARLYASARGVYRAFLNGARVGTDELAPGWTDYTDRTLYQTHDVTAQLRSGENALGLTVADGWWAGYIGFDRRRQGNFYGTDPAGWAALEIEYEDGRHETVATDGSWVESPGEIFYTDLLMGEYIDRRRRLDGWAEPGYAADSWGPALVVDDDLTGLTGQIDEPVRVTGEVVAVSSHVDPEGRTIYDFGQNLVGRVRLPLGALPRDAQVVLRHGEMLEDGRLYTANLRTAEARDVYVSAGEAENVVHPVFTVHGFRYLEVTCDTGPLPAPADVVAEVLHNDFDWAGDIATSNPDVDRLISNIRWGQKGNFLAVPTDCPQRDERLGWLADAQVFLPTATYNADVQAFFTRWMRDVRFAQSDEGSFEDVAPLISHEFADGAPAWGDGGVIIPWHLYRTYGDRRLLAESLPSMRRWVDFIQRENPSLLWRRRVGSNYGDWLQVDADTPRDVLATAYFARSAGIVADAARVLGDDEAAAHYAGLRDRIAEAFVDSFVADDGRIEGDTQTVYLLSLAFDLLPETRRSAAADHLVHAIERHDGLLTTGFVGVSLLCPVLSDIGRDDLAFALLEADAYPSWLYSVRHGATTIWERWDGWTEHGGFQSVEMNSFNHYSLGSVGEWLYRYVVGIDQTPASVGFQELLLQPRPGGSLMHASGSYETPYGLVRSAWERTADSVDYRFEVPPGTTARVVLEGTALLLDGTPVTDARAASSVAVQSGRTSFDVAAGSYRVSAPARA